MKFKENCNKTKENIITNSFHSMTFQNFYFF